MATPKSVIECTPSRDKLGHTTRERAKMKTRIPALAGSSNLPIAGLLILLVAGLGGCSSRSLDNNLAHPVTLTSKEGREVSRGKMTVSSGDYGIGAINIIVDGEHYIGKVTCSLGEKATFWTAGYRNCSIQMNSGDRAIECKFRHYPGGGSGECDGEGEKYAIGVESTWLDRL